MSDRYRVVVVDDSSFMRKFISDLIHQDRDLKVIATAVNGVDAVEKVKELRPDVVTMDIEMPEMDGLTALTAIMQECPTPVVMLSNRTRVGAYSTVRALELGAVDFIAKPSGNISLDLEKIQDELILKVKIAAKSYHRVMRLTGIAESLHEEDFNTLLATPSLQNTCCLPPQKIIAIGTSTGGPRALQTVLSKLPGNIPAGLAIVQHMPPGFTKTLAERLNAISQLEVSEAHDGDELTMGRALVAPGDRHMKIKRIGDRFYAQLSNEPPVGGLRPCIDIMMDSVARCGIPVMGVLLTGMGHDGVAGLKKIQKANGFTIAEDESTCVVYGMPRAAVEHNCVNRVTPIHWVSQEILDHL